MAARSIMWPNISLPSLSLLPLTPRPRKLFVRHGRGLGSASSHVKAELDGDDQDFYNAHARRPHFGTAKLASAGRHLLHDWATRA